MQTVRANPILAASYAMTVAGYGMVAYVLTMVGLRLGASAFPSADLTSIASAEIVAAGFAGLLALCIRSQVAKLPDLRSTRELWIALIVPLGGAMFAMPGIANLVMTNKQTFTQLGLIAVFCLAIGIFEEIIFRFGLMRMLIHFIGTSGALLMSSLIFGMIHMKEISFIAFANVAPQMSIGLLLGLLYIYSGRIIIPILIHALWDFAIFAKIFLPGRTFQFAASEPATLNVSGLVFLLLAVSLWIGYMRVLNKKAESLAFA